MPYIKVFEPQHTIKTRNDFILINTGGGRIKRNCLFAKIWLSNTRRKGAITIVNERAKKTQQFATVRPKKAAKSTTNGQNYWKFFRFRILKIRVKTMVFHGQKSAFSKLRFWPCDIRSLWIYRTTTFTRLYGTKTCQNVLWSTRSTSTTFCTLWTS